MVELRWVTIEGGSTLVHLAPTATDAIEYANEALEDEDEFDCCKSDNRLGDMKNVKRLLNP